MRALLCLAFLGACGPKVDPKSPELDEDIQSRTTESAPKPVEQPRPEAPPGKGLRTGTIERVRGWSRCCSTPVLRAFLRQLEVTPRMNGNRFVGWQLVQVIDRTGPLVDVDVVPGDVLLAVNGKPLSRPDQLQSVDSLRTANELRAQLWRGEGVRACVRDRAEGRSVDAAARERAGCEESAPSAHEVVLRTSGDRCRTPP